MILYIRGWFLFFCFSNLFVFQFLNMEAKLIFLLEYEIWMGLKNQKLLKMAESKYANMADWLFNEN